MLQKRSIRLINKVNVRDDSNRLFNSSKVLKFKDLVDLQVLLVMFKARNRLLPESLQRLFKSRSNEEDHRWKFNFKSSLARTTLKQMCISVYGVKLWNSLGSDMKCCSNTEQFETLVDIQRLVS